MEKEKKTPRNFTLSDSDVAKLDRLRAAMPGVPNRSEAVRKLIAMATEKENDHA